MPSFSDFSEEVTDDALLPPLDRSDDSVRAAGLLSIVQDPFSRRAVWRQIGVLILRDFLPHPLVDAYCARREEDGEYPTGTPYMYINEIRDLALYPPLMAVMDDLVGEEMALHLNLCGWVSTERKWHQDDYLNPPYINGHYCAAWAALGEIGPDSGPFEYVPGSHRWPFLRRDKVLAHFPPAMADNPDWPRLTEDFVAGAMEAERVRLDLPVRKFLPASKGDVLLWHPRLMHRGGKPAVPGTERRALISHYSGIPHRRDMPVTARWHNGASYFVL